MSRLGPDVTPFQNPCQNCRTHIGGNGRVHESKDLRPRISQRKTAPTGQTVDGLRLGGAQLPRHRARDRAESPQTLKQLAPLPCPRARASFTRVSVPDICSNRRRPLAGFQSPRFRTTKDPEITRPPPDLSDMFRLCWPRIRIQLIDERDGRKQSRVGSVRRAGKPAAIGVGSYLASVEITKHIPGSMSCLSLGQTHVTPRYRISGLERVSDPGKPTPNQPHSGSRVRVET